jgi:ketosteroid isomerase-like protein
VSDRSWIDKFAIQELIYRYSDSINRADLAATEAVYAPDAIWESPLLGLRFESAHAFCEFLAESTAKQELLIQTPHCPVIRLLGPDAAQATTTIHEFSRGIAAADGPFGAEGTEINFQDYGIYYDEVARLEGDWKFTHRVFVPIYLEPGAVTGDLPTERSTLLKPV